jgi:hypothetical protein
MKKFISIALFILLFCYPSFPQAIGGKGGTGGVSGFGGSTQTSDLYTSQFPLVENPISENAVWTNGGTTGVDWSNCQTDGTSAFGDQLSFGSANDSTCVLTNVTWGATQTVIAKFATTPTDKTELRLRTTITAHSITGYEIVFSQGSEQIVRWNGAIGNVTVLQTNSSLPAIVAGDVIKATISGSTITAYYNGVQAGTVTDSTYGSGSPGMGFFCSASCTLTNTKITNFYATDGTNTFSEFTPPIENCYHSVTTGTTVSCTLASAPVAGQVVAVSVQTFPVITLSTVKDGANNSYTITPHSCSTTNEATAGNACLAYWLPGITGNTTVTATITGGTCGSCSITVDVFSVVDTTGGTLTFDNDAAGSGTNTVNTPSLTPAQAGWPKDAGELYWGFCTNQTNCDLATGSWTLDGSSTSFGEGSEWQSHVVTTTAVGFVGNVSDQYDTMIMAFKVTHP